MQGGITMETIANLPAIKLVWRANVTGNEVHSIFSRLQTQLSEAEVPHYVILDLSANPQFPLKETTAAALFGPYRHPKAIEWLLIGDSEYWQFIEHTLAIATNERKIRWFETVEEAADYIQQRLSYSN